MFKNAGVGNFERLPKEVAELFKTLNAHLEAAKVQGFVWRNLVYEFLDVETGERYTIEVLLNEETYKVLVLRYKELFNSGSGASGGEDVPYDIDGYLTAIDTATINADYMNIRFEKYMKLLHQKGASAELIKRAEDELHKTFATLSQEEQKYANIFLHDIQRGDISPEEGKTLRDYITEYMTKAKDDQIHRFASVLGLDESKLREFMALKVTETNITEFGKFDALKATVNKAKEYFEQIEGVTIIPPKVSMKTDKLLREFILGGGFDIEIEG